MVSFCSSLLKVVRFVVFLAAPRKWRNWSCGRPPLGNHSGQRVEGGRRYPWVHESLSTDSDLTRPHPKWWFSKGNLLISGKTGLVKYYNLTRKGCSNTVDGRDPANQLRLVVYPINKFFTSHMLQNVFHQQYVTGCCLFGWICWKHKLFIL